MYTTTTTPMIRYTENMKTNKLAELTCNSAEEFENICKTKKNIFEIIPSDQLIVPYFDVDFYTTFEQYSEEENKQLLLAAKKAIRNGCDEEGYDEPFFAVATSSSKKYFCSKTNKIASKYSYHIVITNYKMYMDEISNLVDISNTLYALSYPDCKFLIKNKILDDSPYKKSWQKLRTIYSTKPKENRYLTIVEGIFYNFIICDIEQRIKLNFCLDPEFEPIKQNTNNTKPSKPTKPIKQNNNKTNTDRKFNFKSLERKTTIAKYIDSAINHQLFVKLTGYDIWIRLGYIIKNAFGDDEEGLDLFIELSRQSISYTNDEDVIKQYESLNIDEDGKMLGIPALLQIFKDSDQVKANKVIKECSSSFVRTTSSTSVVNDSEESDNESEIVLDPQYFGIFNTVYFNSLKHSYATQKQYFEMFVCKVLRPEPMYIYCEDSQDSIISFENLGRKIYIYSDNGIKNAFKHCKTIDNKSDNSSSKEIGFITKWLLDSEIKCHNLLQFIPFNGVLNEQQNNPNYNYYNMFCGYNPLINTIYNIEKHDVIVKPIKDLCLELCEGNTTYFNYFWKFLAHMIQKPQERLPIAFIFKSNQGVGKNVFLNAIGNIIGKNHYITSSNPNDFFGEHAEGFSNKLLVNMNECDVKGTFCYEAKLKSFITEDTITVNPKGVRPFELRNYARLVIFTNGQKPLPIDVKSKDRRYCIFQATDKYLEPKYTTSFWSKLIEHFKRPEFIACLYNDLLKTDINIDWQKQRPISQTYIEMCKLFVPIEVLFFETYFEKIKNTDDFNNMQDIPAKEIYNDYVEFCQEGNFITNSGFQTSISKFIAKIKDLNLSIRFHKTSGKNLLLFTPSIIEKELIKNRWIDVNDDEQQTTNNFDEYEDFEFEFE